MAKSSKHHSIQHQLHQLLTSGWIMSIICAAALLLFTYKDILLLRLNAGLFYDVTTLTDSTKLLLQDGLANLTTTQTATFTPHVLLIVTSILLMWMLVDTYKKIMHSFVKAKHYVNAERIPESNIILMYIAFRTASFCLPLLYWTLLLTIWLPHLVRLPITHVASGKLLPSVFAVCFVLLILSLAIHLGVVFSKVSVKVSKHV